MTEILLNEKLEEARRELAQQQRSAENLQQAIETRQNNNTRGKLIAQLVGALLATLLIIAPVIYFGAREIWLLEGALRNLLPVLAIAFPAAFCVLTVLRLIVTMRHYDSLFDAGSETADHLQSFRSALNLLDRVHNKASNSREKNYDMAIKPGQNIPARLRRLEQESITRSELSTRSLYTVLNVLFVLCITACGLYGAASCGEYIHGVIREVANLLDGFDTPEITNILTMIAVFGGCAVQFWPAILFMKGTEYQLPWYSPFLCLLGAAAAWVVMAAEMIIVALIMLVIVVISLVVGICIVGGIIYLIVIIFFN